MTPSNREVEDGTPGGHTPGRWEVTQRCGDPGIAYYVATPDAWVCHLAVGLSPGETLANARLIASAPCLLEAVRPLAPANEETAAEFAAMNPDEFVTVTIPVRCIMQARTAISLATGGETGK